MISDNTKTPHLPQNAVSGSVFHPAISHINCDDNISKETVNAINEMVDCVFSKEEIKESKKFIRNVFKNKKTMNLKIEIKVEKFTEQKEKIDQTFIRVDSEKPMVIGKECPIDKVGKIFMDKESTIKYLVEFLTQNLP